MRSTERGKQWLAGILDVAEGRRTADDLIGEMQTQPKLKEDLS
jgi:hypothetical protein